jgi:hypothetical protein
MYTGVSRVEGKGTNLKEFEEILQTRTFGVTRDEIEVHWLFAL